MYRASGVGISIVLVAAGAIMAWAVSAEVNGVNIHNVGLILFFVGLAGLAVALVASFASGSGSMRSGTTVVEGQPVEHQTVVQAPPVERVERVER
jgi:hypothetical protein